MTVYYNEIDKHAVAWLRELIRAGHIADGVVDDRSIEDVHPRDLDGFAQCHFFAGIGIWSYALRCAGWPDDRPVWTGSCPCQPFSAAGQGAGFDDERHLWPAWHHLIREHKPAALFGEQVASKDADPWLDLVQDDLEALGYAFGAVAFPAAGVGAPHIRDRTYWVADAGGVRHVRGQRPRTADGSARGAARAVRDQRLRPEPLSGSGPSVIVGDACRARLEGRDAGALGHERAAIERAGEAGALADAGGQRLNEQHPCLCGAATGRWDAPHHIEADGRGEAFWAAADWIPCRDGKNRPVEPGTQPLAHGAAARVVRLRGYGNGIVAPAAQAFIEACMSA